MSVSMPDGSPVPDGSAEDQFAPKPEDRPEATGILVIALGKNWRFPGATGYSIDGHVLDVTRLNWSLASFSQWDAVFKYGITKNGQDYDSTEAAPGTGGHRIY